MLQIAKIWQAAPTCWHVLFVDDTLKFFYVVFISDDMCTARSRSCLLQHFLATRPSIQHLAECLAPVRWACRNLRLRPNVIIWHLAHLYNPIILASNWLLFPIAYNFGKSWFKNMCNFLVILPADKTNWGKTWPHRWRQKWNRTSYDCFRICWQLFARVC